MFKKRNPDKKINKLKSKKEIHYENTRDELYEIKQNSRKSRFFRKIYNLLNLKSLFVNKIFVFVIHLVLVMSVTHKKHRDKDKIILLEKYIHKKLKNPNNSFMPSVLAFSMFITLIPIATFIGIIFIELSTGGKNSHFIAAIQNFLNSLFGQAIGTQIFQDLSNSSKTKNWVGIVSLAIISLWISISSSRKIVMVAGVVYNDKYKIPLKSTYIKSSILIFLLNFFIIFSMLLSSFLNSVIATAGKPWIWTMLKIPFMVFIIYVLLIIMFFVTPQESVTWRSVHPGALVASVLLNALINILIFFNQYILKYTSYYGAVASIMSIAFVFLFLSFIIYYGFVINSAIYKVYTNPSVLRISDKKFNKILKSKNERNFLRYQSRLNIIHSKNKKNKNNFSEIPDKEIKVSWLNKMIHKINNNKKNK